MKHLFSPSLYVGEPFAKRANEETVEEMGRLECTVALFGSIKQHYAVTINNLAYKQGM
jgi:hypothetical protein